MPNSHPTRLERGFYRNGEAHRAGADVSFSDVMRLFNFSSIHIGKWVTRQEQQIAANLFFDALCDLMDILQVPEQVISLNGTLSLAFGVGGQKHSSAHYNSAKRQLSLAKNAGGGALAHEWFHAFDHYICDKMYNLKKQNAFASEVWLTELAVINKHPLNQSLSQFFERVFLNDTLDAPSTLMNQSISADKHCGFYYYARPQEVAARAFEACIQNHSLKNTFLVQGTKQTAEAKIGIYPKGYALNLIQSEIIQYFKQLAYALGR
jgi:hypothetical protein